MLLISIIDGEFSVVERRSVRNDWWREKGIIVKDFCEKRTESKEDGLHRQTIVWEIDIECVIIKCELKIFYLYIIMHGN